MVRITSYALRISTDKGTGSFGCLPRPVYEAHNKITEEVEQNPDLFVRRKLAARAKTTRQKLATFLNAEEDECVFVPNVNHGIALILRSIPWEQGDVLTYSALIRSLLIKCGFQFLSSHSVDGVLSDQEKYYITIPRFQHPFSRAFGIPTDLSRVTHVHSQSLQRPYTPTQAETPGKSCGHIRRHCLLACRANALEGNGHHMSGRGCAEYYRCCAFFGSRIEH